MYESFFIALQTDQFSLTDFLEKLMESGLKVDHKEVPEFAWLSNINIIVLNK